MSIAYTMPPAPHEKGGQSLNECPRWFERSHEQELTILEIDSFKQIRPLIRTIKLRNDPIPGFFPYLRSQISLVEMEIDSLSPCALYVLQPNLDLITYLRNTFLELYGIDILYLNEENTRITYNYMEQIDCVISPPIVEVSIDDGPEPVPILIDGLHRVMLARSLELNTVNVIKIEHIACPLIALPVGWEEVKIYDSVPREELKRRYRFKNREELIQWPRSSYANYERFLTGFSLQAKLGALHTHKPPR